MTDRVEVAEVRAAWAAMTIDERLSLTKQRSSRVTRLYTALDALRDASKYPLSIDALD